MLDRCAPGRLGQASAARPFVLDGGAGGAGTAFAWSALAPIAPAHVFVAGGITPANLDRLLPYAPWGIDLSSGIEQQPGRKDHDAMKALFAHLEGVR